MKNKKDAGEFKAPLRVMLRCVWRARVLAAITATSSRTMLASVSFLMVCFLGWIAYHADPTAGELWTMELMAYGIRTTLSDPKATLEALASGHPWAWAAAACLAARARWLWLGVSRDRSQEQAALRASAPLAYWMLAPWLAAGEANARLALRSLGWARSFAASSRTLPEQFAAGLGCSIVAGLAIVDMAALTLSVIFSYFFGVILIFCAAQGDTRLFVGEHGILFAAAVAVWIKQGALKAAWGSIQGLWQGVKARGLKTLPIEAGESAWAALGRAKASLARGLLDSAASDGTLSQAEREALLLATKRKGSDQASKSPSLRL